MLTLSTPNLARDPVVREWVQDVYAPRLLRIRGNRRTLEMRWRGFDNLEAGILDKQSYQGRHKGFLAMCKKLSDTYRDKLRAGFFPLSEWFQVEPIEDITDVARAQALYDLNRYFFEHTMRLKFHFEPFLRQLLVRGTSPMKHAFVDETKWIRRLVAKKGRRGKVTTEMVLEEVKALYGPTLRPVDLYSFFVWPETVDDVESAEIVFEDKETTTDHIRDMATRWLDPENPDLGHYYEHIHDVVDRNQMNPEFKLMRKERFQRLGLVDPTDATMANDRAMLTESYFDGIIPDAKHLDEETGDAVTTGRTRWLITLGDHFHALRVQQMPFWYGKYPYHVPRLFRRHDEFYGQALYEGGADRLNYISNDVLNHTLDGFTLANNPIAIIDPNAHPRINSLRVLPLAKWMVRPDAVRFDRPPDVSASGWGAISFLQSMSHDYGGGSAAFQGQPAARGRGRSQNTATGMSLLMQTSSEVVQSILENLDEELGKPMLQRNLEYVEQFMTDPILLRIGGAGSAPLIEKPIGAQDVIGKYAFRWLGSQQNRERITLAAQMERLVPLMVQVMQADPRLQVNLAELVRRIWTDGLGLHGASKIIKTPEDDPSIDPSIENELVAQDRPIEVHPGDDDLRHAQSHLTEGLARVAGNPTQMQAIMAHVQAHALAHQQKMQAAALAARAAMMAQAGGGPGMPQGARPQSMPTGLGQPAEADLARSMQMGPPV